MAGRKKPHYPCAGLPPTSVPMLARVLSAAVNGIEAFPGRGGGQFRVGRHRGGDEWVDFAIDL